MNKRTALIYMASLVCAIGTVSPAQPKQPDYPNKPIRMVVGVAAGCGADLMARILAQELGESMRPAIAVENRT